MTPDPRFTLQCSTISTFDGLNSQFLNHMTINRQRSQYFTVKVFIEMRKDKTYDFARTRGAHCQKSDRTGNKIVIAFCQEYT